MPQLLCQEKAGDRLTHIPGEPAVNKRLSRRPMPVKGQLRVGESSLPYFWAEAGRTCRERRAKRPQFPSRVEGG